MTKEGKSLKMFYVGSVVPYQIRVGEAFMIVDFNKLRSVIKRSGSSTINAKDSSECMSEFTASLSNYIEHNHGLMENELAMITISMEDWRRKRNKSKLTGTTVDIGDIFYADLGIGYKPELAYAHPVVILEEIRGFYLVLPVSTSVDHLTKAFHPTDRPNGVKYLRKVLRTDGEGFQEDSAIIISNMRTISPGRLHGSKKGALKNITDPSSLFAEIKEKAFKLAFPKYFTQIENLKQEKEILEAKNVELEKTIEGLREELQKYTDSGVNKQ